MRGAALAVTDDEDVHAHRLDVADRVQRGLAFGNARATTGEQQRVGAQAAGSKLKAHPCAGGVFEKQQRHHFAPQRGQLLDGTRGDFLEALCRVQDVHDLLRGQFIQAQQILACPDEAFVRHGRSRHRRSLDGGGGASAHAGCAASLA